MRTDLGARQALRERIDAFPPAARAELLHVLTMPDFDRADRIGDFWAAGNRTSRLFAELLMDCEEDPTTRAVLVGMLTSERHAAVGSSVNGRWRGGEQDEDAA